jgi:hypothetical protein
VEINILILTTVVTYISYIFFLAALRLIFSKPIDQLIVAEVSDAPLISRKTFSKLLGLPLSLEYIKIKKTKVIFWFLLSSACYTVCSGVLIFFISDIGSFAYLFVFSNSSGMSQVTMIFIIIATYFGARKASIKGREVAKNSITELQALDDRPPILFLRAFKDDQVLLLRPRLSYLARICSFGRNSENLDTVLLEEGTDYGPVVALGNPLDATPPYGAARGYFTDKGWKQGVMAMAQSSSAIVLCVDLTDGIKWELDQLRDQNLLHRCLFLVHPRYSAEGDNIRLLDYLADVLDFSDVNRDKLQLCRATKTGDKVVGFFFDSSGNNESIIIGSSKSFSSVSFLLMIRWFFRTKLVAARTTTSL